MSLSSICVCLNAIRLMGVNLDKDLGKDTDDINEGKCDIMNKSCECDKAEALEEKDMVSFEVEGMMCQHCKKRVEDALCSIGGVVTAEADLDAKKVNIETNGEVSEDVLRQAVIDAGYEVK